MSKPKNPDYKFSVSYAKDGVYKQGLREFMEVKTILGEPA